MNPYAKLLKDGRERKSYSMDDLMDLYFQKYRPPQRMTKQNYRKYEKDESLPIRTDYLFLEKIFTLLEIDISILPHNPGNASDMEKKNSELTKENESLKNELALITKELLSFYRNIKASVL